MDSLLSFWGMSIIYLKLLLLVAAVALFVIQAVGLYGMAEKAGVTPRWVAFIPVINAYIWGKIIKEIRVSDFVLPRPEIVLPLAPFIYALLYQVPFLDPLFLLCLLALYATGYYFLYLLYRPDSAAVYTIISIVFPFVVPFFFYSLRNEAPLTAEENTASDAGTDA
ncbi:MAG: hypothetical protein ACOX2X_06215 [Peptococcia bacterium]|jgi:hypothetical protein